MPLKTTISPKYGKVEQTAKRKHIYAQSNTLRRHQSLTWMVLSLLFGMAFAVGHHCFYASFNDHQVDKTSISQNWIVRIGTGMAFIINMFFVISASSACVQHQWLTTRSTPFKVRQIDTISSILTNALGFFESLVWFRFPILLLTAVTAWLLPIAATITPGTISVVPHQDVANSPGSVQQLDYDPKKYGNLQTTVRADYIGPSLDTLRTAYGTAMTGQILPIPSDQPNKTYTLQFYGPALRCDFAEASAVDNVYKSWMNYYIPGTADQYHYLSWVPSTGGRFNLTSTNNFLDTNSTDAAHLYIIPNTTVSAPYFLAGQLYNPPGNHWGYQDLLDCKLYNASYHAFFNFSYPIQTSDVQSRELVNPVNASLDITDWRYSAGSPAHVIQKQAQRICYQSMMDSLGRLLVGYEWWRDGFIVTNHTSWSMMSIDWTTRQTAQRGVEELFQNMTFSMLSLPSLTMNSTMAAQNKVPVSIYSTYNIYQYDPRDLWLAYGIAGGAALVCTVLGLYAMWRNGGAYSNVFSTFIRTSRDQYLNGLISSSDKGVEPLPKDLADTSIILAERPSR